VESLVPALVIAAVLVLVGGLIAVGIRMEKKRTEALEQACRMMGFTFQPDVDLELLKGFGDLPLYAHGHSRRARNLMTGRAGGRDVRLVDYQYTTGSGKNSHTWSQTVALFPEAGEGLPDLLLAPETVFHKIGSAFGYQDIDFESSPDFSSHYLLRGPDEMAIRSAFSVDALHFFGTNRGWHIEVRGGNVGVYRSGTRCKPEELRTFLEETQAALRALVRA
jgi:hypothetical protein